MDSGEVVVINNSVRKYRAQERISKERADNILEYQKLVEEFGNAIDSCVEQTKINLLRKRVNNARLRVTPWLLNENIIEHK
jgi:hypothetical protein